MQIHHSFLHNSNWPANHVTQQQLASQSHYTVRVTCWTVSVLEQSCAQLHARNLYQKKTCTRLTDTHASFSNQMTYTSFWYYKFLERVSPALVCLCFCQCVWVCLCVDRQFPVVAVESEMPIVNPVSGLQYGQLRVTLAMGSLEQISAYQRTKAGHASAIAIPERPASHLERCIVCWQSDVVMRFGVVMVERLKVWLLTTLALWCPLLPYG